MYPSLFTIPWTNWDIKSYGVMMMLAFLIGIYLTVRRAIRVHGDPDIAINMGLMSLIGGLAGARLFFVVHYWTPAYSSNWVEGRGFFTNFFHTAWGIVDMRTGGLEFYGGVMGGVLLIFLYLYFKKVSIRWYMDMIAPSLMFGVMLGRIGCFLNGCCFGRVCRAGLAGGLLAVTFPYGSHPSEWQWQMHDLKIPPELIFFNQYQSVPFAYNQPAIFTAGSDYWNISQKDIDEFRRAQTPLSVPELNQFLNASAMNRAKEFLSQHLRHYHLTVDQLHALAQQTPALPVLPTQLFSALSGLVIWFAAEAIFRYRQRHGLVIVAVLMMYATNRFLEEFLRPDNPFDVFGIMTISQGVAIAMFLIAVEWLVIIYKYLPAYSPKMKPVNFVY